VGSGCCYAVADQCACMLRERSFQKAFKKEQAWGTRVLTPNSWAEKQSFLWQPSTDPSCKHRAVLPPLPDSVCASHTLGLAKPASTMTFAATVVCLVLAGTVVAQGAGLAQGAAPAPDAAALTQAAPAPFSSQEAALAPAGAALPYSSPGHSLRPIRGALTVFFWFSLGRLHPGEPQCMKEHNVMLVVRDRVQS